VVRSARRQQVVHAIGSGGSDRRCAEGLKLALSENRWKQKAELGVARKQLLEE